MINSRLAMINSEILHQLFILSPLPGLILKPDAPHFTIEEVNQAHLKMTGLQPCDLIGTGLFDSFPKDVSVFQAEAFQRLKDSLEKVLLTKKPDKISSFQYECPLANKGFEELLWTAENIPILDSAGEIYGILHTVKLLEQTEEFNQYKSLFYHNPDAVYSFDLEGKFIRVNPASATLAETTMEHLLEITFVPLIPETDAERVYNNFLKAASGETLQYKTGLITVKGNYRIIQVTNMPIMVNNEIIGVYGVAKDITEKEKAEKELEEKTNKLDKILNQSLDVICTIDAEGKFVEVSNASEHIWGYKPEELIGKPYMEFVAEKDHDKTAKIAYQILSGMEYTNFENTYIHRSGNPVPIIWSAKWEPNEHLMYCVGKDATAIKNTEMQLKQSEQLYRSIVQDGSDLITILDLGGKFKYVSPNHLALVGFSPEYILNKTIFDFVHPDDIPAIQNYFIRIETEKRILLNPFRFRHEDGSYMWIETVATNMMDNPSINGILSNSKNITDRRISEMKLRDLNEHLQKQTKELEISNAELEQFAYVASHDLQEPLRMVSSFLRQLEKKYSSQLDEKALQYIHFATQGASQMRQIILDLLQFSIVGKSDVQPEPVNLNELMKEITFLLKTEKQHSKAKIEWVQLPFITAVKTSLQQLFLNLISNGIKYQHPNVIPHVEISCEDKGCHWQFAVKDNGIGINESYHEQIFVIFKRLHHRDVYKGTGMGLAICKKIVENLGGKIWLNSREGQGSTFYFTIPKN